MSVRNFEVLGKNIYSITDKILANERIRQLLINTNGDPFKIPILTDDNLLNKRVLIIPKLLEEVDERQTLMNYIVIMLDEFVPNPINQEFKISTIRFDVVCHFDNWLINSGALRPYSLMTELDKLFNQKKLQGIGNLNFTGADRLVVSPYLGGYSMLYSSTEFN